jgi:hypothetical protein
MPPPFSGRKISQVRNQHKEYNKHNYLTFNGLCELISQKIELFITTAVRTPTPTVSKIFGFRRLSKLHRNGAKET